MRILLTDIDLAPPGGFKGKGPLGLEKPGSAAGATSTFATFISSTIGLMTIIAIIWFIFVFITGAIGIITAGGDKASLENARKKIVTGLIGLVVVIIAVFVIDLIGDLIGIPNILDIGALINSISPK